MFHIYLTIYPIYILKFKPFDIFKEDELRLERGIGNDDDRDFDNFEKFVLGKSIDDFKAARQTSKSKISPHTSSHDIGETTGDVKPS